MMDDPQILALQKTAAAIAAVQGMLDALKDLPQTDGRSLAVARTQFEGAFLWATNAAGGEPVFK